MKKQISTIFMIMGGIFFTIGALFVVLGSVILYDSIKFKEIAETGNALITDIETYYSEDETRHNVFVRYEVDGQIYNEKLNYYTSGMHEGDIITIYYDPENPTRISGDDSGFMFGMFIGIGSIFTLIGLGFLIKAIIDKRMVKRVLAMNCIIQAQIGDFGLNKNLTVNGRHPYVLRASAISPYDGHTYEFRSDAIWNDLTPILQTYNITKVPVYVNPQNYKEYYMDTNYFQQYLGNGMQ